MRRIKSAPANICMMCHNKITNKNISEKKNVLLDTSSEIKIADIKTKKQAITTSSNIISDAITNSNLLSFEENYLIGFILSYFSENVIKKDKFRNLEAFLIQNGIRFIISYLIHKHVFVDIAHHTINLH